MQLDTNITCAERPARGLAVGSGRLGGVGTVGSAWGCRLGHPPRIGVGGRLGPTPVMLGGSPGVCIQFYAYDLFPQLLDDWGQITLILIALPIIRAIGNLG